MTENGRQRLTSWKEIAAHLGRDVRTVLRWEKQRGLPVHRVPGATGRVVFAYTDELDAWARGASAEKSVTPPVPMELPAAVTTVDGIEPAVRPAFSSRLFFAAAALIVVLASIAALLNTKGSAAATEVTRVTQTDTSLEGRAADGTLLWSYQVGRRFEPTYSHFAITDLNGDGHADVTASLTATDPGSGGFGLLVAVDHTGRRLWEHTTEDTLTFAGEQYGPTWGADDLVTFKAGGQPFLAWASHHHTWWPSILSVFNGRGDRTAMFVNSGWILDVLPSTDGKYLLAGGINNARGGASFAILDPRQPGGASPEESGSKYECDSCPPGRPVRYYVIPWSDIVEPTSVLDGRRGQFISFANGTIELRAVQKANAEMIVELTPDFEIKRRSISDGFWEWHAKLERDGVLKHSRDRCPFRNGPVVYEWMREHGWRELRP